MYTQEEFINFEEKNRRQKKTSRTKGLTQTAPPKALFYGTITRVTCLPGLGGGAIEHVERTLNQLNGYHEDILEVLKNAASRRELAGTPSGSSNLLDEDTLRKSLAECGYPDMYRKDTDGQDNGIDNGQEEEEDDVELQPPCGTIRIRTLEDLIRQLEHGTTARYRIITFIYNIYQYFFYASGNFRSFR